jgi:hypothetical protein
MPSTYSSQHALAYLLWKYAPRKYSTISTQVTRSEGFRLDPDQGTYLPLRSLGGFIRKNELLGEVTGGSIHRFLESCGGHLLV